jgi:hypothetical protein
MRDPCRCSQLEVSLPVPDFARWVLP